MAEEFVGNTRVSHPILFGRGESFTYPLARLSLDETGIVLSVLPPPRWWPLGRGLLDVEPIKIPYEELIRAERWSGLASAFTRRRQRKRRVTGTDETA